jgi:hypothetical protein
MDVITLRNVLEKKRKKTDSINKSHSLLDCAHRFSADLLIKETLIFQEHLSIFGYWKNLSLRGSRAAKCFS